MKRLLATAAMRQCSGLEDTKLLKVEHLLVGGDPASKLTAPAIRTSGAKRTNSVRCPFHSLTLFPNI